MAGQMLGNTDNYVPTAVPDLSRDTSSSSSARTPTGIFIAGFIARKHSQHATVRREILNHPRNTNLHEVPLCEICQNGWRSSPKFLKMEKLQPQERSSWSFGTTSSIFSTKKWFREAFTRFPKDPTCEVCKRTKITRALCRNRSNNHMHLAAKFGDRFPADHEILNE